ncbi:hypothetical protein K488DRAFT_74273 [Vararia minispora EC-137]|uniref:Uncharacterized protein n=1 Tax=Vararia minispora EC-137 TaxID=1314806 RepID=A0ACB8Q7T9_9AGAM|nr:hypothetical protein K488DRAFT_74273 [Vararia minispora EC-137]
MNDGTLDRNNDSLSRLGRREYDPPTTHAAPCSTASPLGTARAQTSSHRRDRSASPRRRRHGRSPSMRRHHPRSRSRSHSRSLSPRRQHRSPSRSRSYSPERKRHSSSKTKEREKDKDGRRKKKDKGDKEERRSILTGKKIKLRVDRDASDRERDKNRADLLRFLNAAY